MIKYIQYIIKEELITIISSYTYYYSIVIDNFPYNLQYNPSLFNNIFMKVIDDVVDHDGSIVLDSKNKDQVELQEKQLIAPDGTINFRTIYEYTAEKTLEHYNFLNGLIGEKKIKIKINDKEVNLGFVDVLKNLEDYCYSTNNKDLPKIEDLLKGIQEYLEELKNTLEEEDQKRILNLKSSIDDFLKDKIRVKLLNITNNFSKLIIDLNKESKLNKEQFKGQLTHDKVNLAELFDHIENLKKDEDNFKEELKKFGKYLKNKYIEIPKLIQEIKETSKQIKKLSKKEPKTKKDEKDLEDLRKKRLEKQKELLKINNLTQYYKYLHSALFSALKREIDAIDFRIQELEKVNNVEGNEKVKADINKLKQIKLDNFDLIIQEYEERNNERKGLISKATGDIAILRAPLESKVERLNKKIYSSMAGNEVLPWAT